MRFYEIVGNILGVDPKALTDVSSPSTISQWDSLRHIEVIFALESAYQVRFTMPEISRSKTLGDMRRLLMAKSVQLAKAGSKQKIA